MVKGKVAHNGIHMDVLGGAGIPPPFVKQCGRLAHPSQIDENEVLRAVGQVMTPMGWDNSCSIVAMNFPEGTTEIQAMSFFTWFVPVIYCERIPRNTTAGEGNFIIVRFFVGKFWL